MKINFLKRMLAGNMAALLLASTMTMLTASAADPYYVEFAGSMDPGYEMIIEGTSINTRSSLPSYIGFDPNTPFRVRIGDVDVSDQKLLNIIIAGSKSHQITATMGSADGTGTANPETAATTTYILEPNLLGTGLTDGNGQVSLQLMVYDDDGNLSYQPQNYAATVKTPGLALTKDSSFSFTLTQDAATGAFICSPITDAINDFKRFQASTPVIMNEIEPAAAGQRTFEITVYEGVTPVKFALTMPLAADAKLGVGSKFTINYSLIGTLQPLVLNVISAKQAVTYVAQSLDANPTSTTPAFIKLGGADQLNSISGNFTLLTRLQRYVYDAGKAMDIKWEWKPEVDTPENRSIMVFGTATDTQVVTVNARQEDVKGKLVATVSYKYKDSAGAEKTASSNPVPIDVTILGLGERPSLMEVKHYVGKDPVVTNTALPDIMDIYQGQVAGYAPPSKPYKIEALLGLGTGRGKAEEFCLEVSGETGALSFTLDGRSDAYTPGTWMKNEANKATFVMLAEQKGQVVLTFKFKVRDAQGKLVDSSQTITKTISVVDTSPKNYAEFSDIRVMAPDLIGSDPYLDGKVNYGFDSSVYNYTIKLPYAAKSVTFTPSIPADKGVNNKVRYWIDNVEGQLTVGSGTTGTVTLPLPDINTPHVVIFEAMAQDGGTQWYILEVSRSAQSADSALKALSIKNEKAEELLPSFQPGQTTYEITVPYNTRWVQVNATRSSFWAALPHFDPALIGHPDYAFTGANWMKLGHPNDIGFPGLTPNTILKVTSYAENDQKLPDGTTPAYATTYIVKITRRNPSLNNSIKSAVFKDKAGKELPLDNGAVFAKDEKNYVLRIPYSTDKLTLEAMPDDLVAQEVRVTLPDGTIQRLPYTGADKPLSFALPTPVAGVTKEEFTLTLEAQSEQGSYTTPPYTFHVFRNPPDRDDALQSLELFDQNKKPITRFAFNPQKLEYELSVPFATDQVIIQPKARSPLATVFVDSTKMEGSVISQTVFLRPGESKTALVKVYPEDVDAQPKVYTLKLYRELAGTEARLKSLTAAGGDPLSPAFVPSTAVYHVNLPKGQKSLTFTAVPVSPDATMTLNNEVLLSGVASAAYEPLTAQSVVTLVVTAQDGQTKMTYTINVTCQDMLYKSNDATLSSLTLDYGALSPKFRTNITDYEVAVKDEASSIIITPTATDPGAKIQVFNDSKELGDYRETFAASLADGENSFRIKVTASDEKTIKEYNLIVYRKEEEKQGTMKPITPAQIPFDQDGDIIVVDISKYAVVSAEVFNTLMLDYPQKTLVFEGNDYSLELRGKDMTKLVPYEQVFDLSLSFKSTYEDDIWDLIMDNPRNNRVEPVFIQFNHHGALPAPMRFTISLGRQYRNQSGAWNYYNEERDRIDFYGSARTNSRGNFAVILTHMSTYLYSEYQIAGAENKVGDQAIGSYDGGGSIAADKYNPNTGTKQ